MCQQFLSDVTLEKKCILTAVWNNYLVYIYVTFVQLAAHLNADNLVDLRWMFVGVAMMTERQLYDSMTPVTIFVMWQGWQSSQWEMPLSVSCLSLSATTLTNSFMGFMISPQSDLIKSQQLTLVGRWARYSGVMYLSLMLLTVETLFSCSKTVIPAAYLVAIIRWQWMFSNVALQSLLSGGRQVTECQAPQSRVSPQHWLRSVSPTLSRHPRNQQTGPANRLHRHLAYCLTLLFILPALRP